MDFQAPAQECASSVNQRAMVAIARCRAGPDRHTLPARFARTYRAAAERAGKALGVDPDVLLGQWGLETRWGQAIIPGTHNLGNIKDFSGRGVAAVDSQTGSLDKYRAFASPAEFADQYAALIQRRYPAAVGAGAHAGKFGTALKAGGYAEDANYAAKLQASYRVVAGERAPLEALPRVVARAAPGDGWDALGAREI
jgi:flagellum-specific peptidoglycan hydrolase FlgJ